jgi:Dihydrofolate reductase
MSGSPEAGPRPRFTLLVVASEDGFIARAPGHAPADWASAEEQALFLDAVDRADWGIMGRTTHEAAFKPHRRRIVLSSAAPKPEWRTERHLWLDPDGASPDALAALAAPTHPLREGLILGGTRVHDWFADHGRIDAAELTIEPVRFGDGLTIFSDQGAADPVAAFAARGLAPVAERALNAGGTRLVTLRPAAG